MQFEMIMLVVKLREFVQGQIVFGFKKGRNAGVIFSRNAPMAAWSFFRGQLSIVLFEFEVAPDGGT